MTQILEIPTAGGESVFVEVRQPESLEHRAGSKALIEKSATTLEAMLAKIRPLASAAVTAIQGMGTDEMTLEVGVNLSLDGNVVFASVSTEANFKVSLTWKGQTKTTDEL
ncbi:CU044_2847 family protein [uncultured Gimesia sp.]|mgnify:CR=1 FL=1|uniref:CU044_2847 family protein n=1 Tax=uncultured Gimesia sp. TaxID=1678688 RepID=UPI0030D9BA95|tara:strand:- start:44561 stop:44890 length:330 start_codon:yes stop_codon:yes gene_type:complete